MRTSDQIDQLAPAFANAQGAINPAKKDSENPHFKSKYADLSSVWEACRQALVANGLFVTQDLENPGAAISVTTRITHVSGQWMEFGPLSIPMAKPDAHGAGSAASYGRRYALSAALGIVSDDDDGNGAAQPETKPERARRAVPASQPPTAPAPSVAASYACVTEEQAETIRAAAKKAGIKNKEDYASALVRFSGVNDTRRIPADKYDMVLEQIELLNAPDPFAEPDGQNS